MPAFDAPNALTLFDNGVASCVPDKPRTPFPGVLFLGGESSSFNHARYANALCICTHARPHLNFVT